MEISATGLTKTYGSRLVVDDLSFTLEPGKITGFLGPNGSGKSTTMSMMLGLISGEGETLFEGKKYRSLENGPRRIGAYLGPDSFHPNQTASDHLRISAFTRGVKMSRVNFVLDEVGLGAASSMKTKRMSTGMLQKLGIAEAILSEPEVLILDEPANGLDPESVQWLRGHLQDFAHSGGTVLLSSHLLHEISQFADNLLVIAQGSLIASEPLDSFLKRQKPSGFRVRSSQSAELVTLLDQKQVSFTRVSADVIEVQVETSSSFTKLAVQHSIELDEVTPVGANVEDIFLQLTSDKNEYSATKATQRKGKKGGNRG